MVTFIADVDAGIVQDGRIFEPLALFVGHPVDGARPIEQRQREPRDLVRVIRPVTAAFGQFDHAAAPHIGIAVRLRDLLAVLGDVIEDQTFAKRQVAEADLGGVEPLENRIEQDRPGDGEVATSRVEPRHFEPLLEIERRHFLAHAMDLFGRDPSIANRRSALALARGNGAQAQDGAGRADDPVETRIGNFLQVFVELGLDVFDEFSFIA